MIKALKGEVYGAGVRDIIQYDAMTTKTPLPIMSDIKCRFKEVYWVRALYALMRVDYDIIHPEARDYTDWCFRVRLRPPCFPGAITIHVTTMVRNLWRLERPFFDVDTLASNSLAIYVYTPPTPNEPLDTVTSTMSRILAKRFSLFQIDTSNKRISQAIAEAVQMVQNGWIMDDHTLGARSWIACPWKDVKKPRIGSEKPDVCSICQDTFTLHDIVISLPCAHSFHGFCDQTHKKGGVVKWLEENPACPCCRKVVIQ
ncbi:hypothetical protein TSOC_000461 [Tetrabaena socialis]|uniref:RING-type domain-containing protein n=1 Tax=Tetrabaena socialis TaxID=47790 RepID=A0A2J8AJA4_9CHLO|nr:hypothetical protein TSOC_000461 [Tetrabaena socialis]|eukprot:PNH12595.1 hypothetical protein TSOC_000461 [Tetrabaena socialis]